MKTPIWKVQKVTFGKRSLLEKLKEMFLQKRIVIGYDPGHPEGDRSVVYTPEKWLIWSIEHNGWWAPAERGYVHNKDDAGVYSYEQACEIVAGANRDMQRPNEAMVKIEIHD